MTSILTNVAAMSALQTLRSISSDMEDTQARVSSGLRVGGASDNAAYWSIATTMRSDNMALSAVQDALGLGAAKVDTAYAGMNSSIEVVKEIKKKLVAATEDGVDKTKIQEEISQLQDQLKSISEAASFSGENWLEANVGDKTSVVASFVRDSSGSVSVKKVAYDLTIDNVLFDKGGDTGILDQTQNILGDGVAVNVNKNGTTATYNVPKFTSAEVSDAVTLASGSFDAGGKIAWTVAGDGAGAGVGYVKVADDVWVAAVEQDLAANNGQEAYAKDGTNFLWQIDTIPVAASSLESVSEFKIDGTTTGAQLDGLITLVDEALGKMTSAAADLGSMAMRIGLQEDFVSKLTDSIDSGVGRLVDADMNEESTRLKALQTQQQLAIQSLSIANSASESILTLFR
ncbi:flagellin N-terminal helical domain-containing protein [Shinella zoogloeoides]|uniref:Flagellin n=1 Tax=Shinella zoogloeoides TaxID=352475 RepID=A0A6N8TK73_SHIZO|nr:flagellin [Shinella zoogloeoides]MXO01638.1 flagellin [Shinella zoogloeoides]UEX82085.1 flagellin [Shinella zoogloeoides]